MGAFGDPRKHEPLTNRGVELAEATFCGAETSDRGPHVPGKKGPWARGYSSTYRSNEARLIGSGY